MKLIKIIERIALDRIMKLNNPLPNATIFTIQISSTFMKYLVEEISTPEFPIIYNSEGMEFKYKYYDYEWTIMNRAYRDDTNDEDVENLLYTILLSVKY
jgi:hypothetical protein